MKARGENEVGFRAAGGGSLAPRPTPKNRTEANRVETGQKKEEIWDFSHPEKLTERQGEIQTQAHSHPYRKLRYTKTQLQA